MNKSERWRGFHEEQLRHIGKLAEQLDDASTVVPFDMYKRLRIAISGDLIINPRAAGFFTPDSVFLGIPNIIENRCKS